MRSSPTIEKEIVALELELSAAEQEESRNQYRQIVLDEIEDVRDLEGLKVFIAEALVPIMVDQLRFGTKDPDQ